MATNLVSLVMNFLTPDMIGRIASALGLDRTDTSTAVGAGVPALLAALVGAAAKPGGSQKIADAAKQEMGTFDKFAGMLGGAGASSVTDRGSNILASLLGDRDQSALANSIGKYSGLGSVAGDSVLGMLTPLVMGAIGQQQGSRGLDAGSITNLLTSQKDNIAAAIPSGFGRLLGGTGLLDSLGDTAKRAVMAGGETRGLPLPQSRELLMIPVVQQLTLQPGLPTGFYGPFPRSRLLHCSFTFSAGQRSRWFSKASLPSRV